MCCWPETSLLMTRPSVLSERLMADASLSCSPSVSAALCRSLPAQCKVVSIKGLAKSTGSSGR